MLDVHSLRLIAITDDLRDGVPGLVARCAAAVRGGATMVQLRLKDEPARVLVSVARALVEALPVPVIVNDRTDVALAAGAAGVHVGMDDLPVSALRPVVPPGFVIGASFGTEAELEHARGADYVGVGPVFATASKTDAGAEIGTEGLARLVRIASAPAVGIGGVDATNAAAVIAGGAVGVAVIRSVLGATDPESAARTIRRAIGS